jgi:acid phosphatase type 7
MRPALLVVLLALAGESAPVVGQNTLVPEGATRYAPSIFPDRIILTWTGNPATTQAVSWRTDSSVIAAVAEISEAWDTPGLHLTARQVQARTRPLQGENGLAHHHQAEFTGLRPNTLYAYRLQGGGTWSEWFQFRTAETRHAPFSFLYFGDAQNAVKSHFSRTIRAAYRDLPMARFMVLAGDLVNLRGGNFDDEWGEWFDAGGWLHGMVPSIGAPGNHEHLYLTPGGERRVLDPRWNAQFNFPKHGPAGHEGSVYYVDYQGVRIIALNSYAALEEAGSVEAQARWLEGVLASNPNQWTVVVHHHPMFSVSLGRNNPPLREHWMPLYDRYGVDLVLQGHDHTYGRQHTNVTEGVSAFTGQTGTMYVVSVAGPKMYFVSDAASRGMTRTAEDTQLYQLIHVDADRLRYEAFTVSGTLYDAFELIRLEDGGNGLVDRGVEGGPLRRCGRPEIPGYRADRCWEGSDFIRP